MKRFIIVVFMLTSIASALDSSGWFVISDLEYCILSASTAEESPLDPFSGNPGVEFNCTSDILRCVFSFTTADTSYPVYYITDQKAFFYFDAPEASLHFSLIDLEDTNNNSLYSVSVLADCLSTSGTNMVEFQDGSTISFNLEYIDNPEIYW